MTNRSEFFALDLGTTKFCLARFNIEMARIGAKPLEVISTPADGMRRGMLSDFEKAKQALRELIAKAEESFATDIDRVVVGVAGSHLASHKDRVSVDLSGNTIASRDLQDLRQKAWDHYHDRDRKLLHCVPLQYQIDERAPCDNPLGFTGRFFHGDFLYIHADQNYLHDVMRLCNQVGLQVDRLFSEPYSSSVVIFSEQMLRQGVAIADIGGGTTDGMVFLDGKAERCFTINIGGMLMTHDLSVGLNTDYEQAEQHKRMLDLFNQDESETTRDQMARKILFSRLEELAQHFAKELTPYKGRLNAGLYLTGGGSQVKGLAPYLQYRLKIPVRIMTPKFHVAGADYQCEQNGANEFSTVLGLMKLELLYRQDFEEDSPSSGFRRYIKSFVQWIKEMS